MGNKTIDTWATNLLNMSNANKPTNKPKSKINIRRLLEDLSKHNLTINYDKADGTTKPMRITLNQKVTAITPTISNSLIAHIEQTGNITVWSCDADNWRTLKVANIELTCGEIVTAQEPDPINDHLKTDQVQLTIAQQTAIFFWLSNIVHKRLKAEGKDTTVNVHFQVNTNTCKPIRVIENNTGLGLDI